MLWCIRKRLLLCVDGRRNTECDEKQEDLIQGPMETE